MKKSRFIESQILSILKESDAGLKVSDICRKHYTSVGSDSIDLRSTTQLKTTAYGKPWAVFFWGHQGTMDFGESFGVFVATQWGCRGKGSQSYSR